MITNINTIQFGENIDEAKEKYLVQAVANLGQRLGVKGDSVIANSFSFREMFSEASNSSTWTSEKHIGFIRRRSGSMSIGICPKSSLNLATTSEDTIELAISNSGNILVTDTFIEATNSKVDGIEFFKDSAVIAARSSNYVFCGIGCDSENNPKMFVFEEFKKDNIENNITNAVKLLQFEGHNLVIVLENNDTEVDVTTYELPSGDENLSNVLDDAYGILRAMNGDVYDTTTGTYRSYGVTNEAKVNQMSVKWWLNVFKTSKYSSTKMTARYVKNSGDTSIDWYNPSSSTIHTRYGNSISDALQWFTYDSSMLSEIKKIYSQDLYASTNDDFKQQILCALFNGIYDKQPSTAVVYIPLDYEFNYYCNSNEQWKIYGNVNDISVRFVNKSFTPYNISTYYSESNLLANISDENRTALYGFNVEYDSEDVDLVFKINVEKLYTLPYINSDNVWVVNDQTTSIPANGEDAGNPNIIIVYNYNNNDDPSNYQVLHAAKEELISSWTIKWTCIPPIDQINIDDNTIVSKGNMLRVGCRLPSIVASDKNEKQDLIGFLRYSLVICVSSVDCILENDDVIERYGRNGTVTTLWRLNEALETFEPITNPKYDPDTFGEVAMDITALTNLNNIIKWHIQNTEYKHPDKYSNKWVVLDNANYELKNNTNDYQTYIYPVILNKKSSDFNEANYDNNLNLFLKYTDNVVGAEEENITSVDDSNSKYLLSSKVAVSNALYYVKNGLKNNYFKEYIPNTNFPTLNLSEVLTQNINISNRTNIISFDHNGGMYYSYIGTTFEDLDKNVLRIGTSKKDINLGKESLVNNLDSELFNKHDKLSLDFPFTNISGELNVDDDSTFKENIYIENIQWDVDKHTRFTVYKTNFIPESKYLFQEDASAGAVFEYSSPLQFNNSNKIKFKGSVSEERITEGQIQRYYDMASTFSSKVTNRNEHRLWIPTFYVFNKDYITTSKIIYLGDALYIPGLLCKLGLDKYSNKLSNVDLTSNMDILTYAGNPLMLMTSNRFIKDIDYSSMTTTNDNAHWSINDKYSTFTGNSLDISWYEDERKFLYITVNEASNPQTISNLFKIKLDY